MCCLNSLQIRYNDAIALSRVRVNEFCPCADTVASVSSGRESG